MRRLLAMICLAVVLATTLAACGRVGSPLRPHERKSRAAATEPAPDADDGEDTKEKSP